jgi:hypothetical protein
MGATDADRRTGPERRRRQFRLRSLMMIVALVAVWAWALRMPGVGGLLLVLGGAVAIGLGVLLGAMFLGLLGFGLFALYDRLAARGRAEPQWQQPIDDWAQ